MILFFSAFVFADSNTMPADSNKIQAQKNKAVENWQDLRFGLFIHWGPVSIKGTEIGWSRGGEVPKDEYDNLYKQFNPQKFNAAQWVKFAKDAGVKYIVITSKHHDGFCIWDSAFTDYDILSSPFKRDILSELSAECKKQGMKFGVYYSICDWHHPDYPTDSPGGRETKPKSDIKRYFTYVKNQLKEILTKYGPVSVLWFDGHWEDCWPNEYGEQLYKYVKELAPDIVINNRLSRAGQRAEGASFVGDYETPEQEIGQFDLKRPWESCITIGTQWAWKPNDQIKPFKECIETLVRTAGNSGNLLLNIGPMPDGAIEPRQADRFYEIGAWLKSFGESIYATRGGPYMPGNWGASTHKDNKIYLHILDWKGSDTLLLPPVNKKITASKLLGGGNVEINQTESYLKITVSKENQKQPDTIVVLELDGNASEMKPIDTSAEIEIQAQ